MRAKTGGKIRTWSEWQKQLRSIECEDAIAASPPPPVRPLDGNVLGGPLDGARFPDGTREGLKYEWDGKRWTHV